MKKRFLELPIRHRIFFATVAFAVLSACVFAGTFYAKKAFTSPAPSFPADFRMPTDPFQMKGETSGIGTHFAITDSEYLNITLDSTETVDIKLTSIPKVITMMIEATTTVATTQITLSGLLKTATYYKYEDDYHNLTQFTSDNNGAYSYTQDISVRHFVFIQTRKSTKFIADNETGGDCATIGNWNTETKTCTLTQDLTETVQIDSDGITFDGNGHKIVITPEYTVNGVYTYEKTGVTIKNLVVNNSETGIFLNQSDHSIIFGNTLIGNALGISVVNGDNNTIERNIANGNFFAGIVVWGSSDNRILDNTAQENDFSDFDLMGAYNNPALCNNTITGNIGSGNRPIGFFNSSAILNGDIFSELILCNADNSELRNVSVKSSPDKNNAGFFVFYTDHSNFTDITFNDSAFGMVVSKSNFNNFNNITVENVPNAVSFTDSDSNIIKNLSTPNAPNEYAGILLSRANDNEFDNAMQSENLFYVGLFESNSNIIHNFTISCYIHGTDNLIYNNNILRDSCQVEGTGNSFNLPKPIGGNYWSDYHTPVQGCNDANNDGFCDAPYILGNTQDNLPWTRQDGWKVTTTPPTLTLATTTEDDFIQDEKGVADKTNFTFSVVYTDPSGATTSPQIRLALDGPNGTSSLSVRRDMSTTTPIELHDGDFTNGELFARTLAFPKGTYLYHYEANGGAQRFPSPPAGGGELTFTTGYSNVAFLPGIMGSRLYDEYGKKQWEPDNVTQLPNIFLNENGIPNNLLVSTKDIINETYYRTDDWPGTNTYKTFQTFMNDEVVGNGIIKEWEALPYDWRLDFDFILLYGNKNGENIWYTFATETPYILQEMRRLADTSDTGKVTIIAHSMGGLIAKDILVQVKDQDHQYHDLASKVDRLIMVATPQEGSVKAVMNSLHGISENVLIGSSTRVFAENMPSAYALFPTDRYFSHVFEPPISFDDSSRASAYRTRYGSSIYNPAELREFVLGAEGRPKPEALNIYEPNILNDVLYDKARETQSLIDSFTPDMNDDGKSDIEVIQIAGWGLDTPKTIKYVDTYKCIDTGVGSCVQTRGLYPILDMTTDGDETVLIPSALDMATDMEGVERWWVNLAKHNGWWQFNRNRSHASILETEDIQRFLKNIIQGSRIDDEIGDIIKDIKPIDPDTSNRLRFRLDSPASLDMYDTEGRHTGIIPSPVPNSDLQYYENNIPDGYYLEFGGSKYSGVSTVATTTLKLVGQTTGTISLTIEEVAGDNSAIASSTYANIPIRQGTRIDMDIQNVKTASPLRVDLNGDGTIDFSIKPNETKEPIVYLKQIRAFIETMQFKNKGIKTAYLAQVSAMEKMLSKKQKMPVLAMIKAIELESKIHIKTKLIGSAEGETLIFMFERLKEVIIK
ncbi:MAG: NosD domain-containing protein [Candidatus Paceibacterota bacterium]|jgi:parallel beta-helix repeat protein